MTSGEETTRSGGDRSVAPRSRTALVIDELLSRGRRTGPAEAGTGGGTAPEQWSSISPVLRGTAPSILLGHLAWLATRARSHDHLSSERILLEDQARILIRALDERDEDEAVTWALDHRWAAADVVGDDAAIVLYAWELSTRTAGQLPGSPSAALADSAARVVAEVLDHRADTPHRAPGEGVGGA
jgi:hypothetical protein